MLVAEAVYVFAVILCLEGVVAVGGRLLVDLELAVGVGDLWVLRGVASAIDTHSFPRGSSPSQLLRIGRRLIRFQRTQKSISRLPAPPNSLSPTWNDTVILSSRWSISWKHSRPWAGSWMLWAMAEVKSPAARSSDDAEKNCILLGGRVGRLGRLRGGGGMRETQVGFFSFCLFWR